MRIDLSETEPQFPTFVILSGKIILVTIAYILLGYLCTSSPLWFPAGLGLTALLLWGPIVGFGIFSGDFSLNLILGEAWEFAIVSALGSTIGALVGLKCLRYFRFSPYLIFLKDVFNLVFWAAIGATTIHATLETLFRVFDENLFGSNIQRTWSLLWLGDSTGVILITPFLLRLRYDWQALGEPSKLRWLEAFLCLGLLGCVGWLVFDAEKIRIDALLNHLSNTQYLEYLPFPFVIWAAIRFYIWGAVSANLLVALLAIAGAITGVGTFVLQIANYEQAILLLQIFLMILGTTSLCLSAAMSERQHLNNTLEEQVIERTLQLQAKMQEQEQLLKMKTVFFQAVAHDLRTSIMGLSMLLNNLQKGTADEFTITDANLERMIQSSDRQLTLINALAEDHFAEQHSLSLDRQSILVSEIINPLLNDFSPVFRQNKIRLNNQISFDLPKINVDVQKIRLVFAYLLTNAVKHNPPEIQITLKSIVESSMLKCTISDNGIGMTSEQCQQLFKLYVRNLHNHRLTGIGLGSYQCRQIIEAHGGQIGVESMPQVGSQFWFTLPLA